MTPCLAFSSSWWQKDHIWRRVMTIWRICNNVVWPQCQTASEWGGNLNRGQAYPPISCLHSRPDFLPSAAPPHHPPSTNPLSHYSAWKTTHGSQLRSRCNIFAETNLRWLLSAAIPFCLEEAFIIQTRRWLAVFGWQILNYLCMKAIHFWETWDDQICRKDCYFVSDMVTYMHSKSSALVSCTLYRYRQ